MEQTDLTVSNPRRLSRDEMNLAEFPLTVLSKRTDPKLKTLEFTDILKGRDGKPITRRWIITAADKFGLPTASDDEVLLGLLKLTVNEGFRDRKVYFTRYDLLHQLRWTTEGRSYRRLQNALDRLSGVRIKATNAFFDNETKSHSTRNFGIVDAYELNDGRDTNPKPSFFVWSEVMFKSFQVGFIKKLDLDFFLGLKSAVSKRLYRYLDKHFWYRSRVDIGLFMLCHEKLGISRNYRFASSLRQQLDPAIEELMSQRFLSGYEYSGKGADTQVTLFAASATPRVKAAESLPKEAALRNEGVLKIETKDLLKSSIEEMLIARGIKQHQLSRLLDGCAPDILERIKEIILHFDNLVRSNSRLVSRSPVGFLYRAVENPRAFLLPKDSSAVQTKIQFAGNSTELHEQGAGKGGRLDVKSSKEGEYLTARRKEIERIRLNVEPTLLKKVSVEVQSALRNVKGLISEERFEEAVNHGVEEKLLKLYAFPDFVEWARKNP